MTRILRSPREWIVVAIVAVIAMAYFTAGSLVLARLANSLGTETVATLLTRSVFATIVAAVMLAVERRRENPSIDAAAVEAIKVAAIVVVADNLVGVSDGRVRLAARTALILGGLPLLAVLTHILSQRLVRRSELP